MFFWCIKRRTKNSKSEDKCLLKSPFDKGKQSKRSGFGETISFSYSFVDPVLDIRFVMKCSLSVKNQGGLVVMPHICGIAGDTFSIQNVQSNV